MTALLWSINTPTRCACTGAYRPVLTAGGKMVKSREPAWSMAESTRDGGCLQERCRALAKLYRTGYQHHGDSRKSGKGYPDCHFWVPRRSDGHGGGSLFMELKRMDRGYPDDRDNPSDDQVRVMAELQASGHRVYLVRPCCVLSGVVDEILADFTGRRCLYAGGNQRGKVPIAGVVADIADIEPRATPPSQPRRTPPGLALPGTEPLLFAPAVAYVVGLPRTEEESTAVCGIEDWLAAAGFPKTSLPFPIRFVVGERAINVQVRVGLARAGRDERVWRGGVPAVPFPEHLVEPACADACRGLRSDEAADLIGSTPASSTLSA